ncbi:orotidine-5'-phosphate decarboxylase, partial [Ruminococcaceae bacterium OttesenSCG-928-I18]|nr:orotidine-5'-phosphate decarboxylase [Ruminococcaceae bacterium OttesenSCG-928-I18]
MPKDVIIACDFPSREETFSFLKQFKEDKPYIKIGMELFYSAGPDIVREAVANGHKVFLDLKLHDIPNTVRRSMKTLAALGASMTNLHAAGGRAMMAAALEGLSEGASGPRPLLLAVTVLTSLSDEMLQNELFIPKPATELVPAWAANAQAAGLDGVVCSPLEAGLVKEKCDPGFLTVTPGIRYLSG